MRKTPGLIAAAAGVLGILCVPLTAGAQAPQPASRLASLASSGAIQGSVQDEAGTPVAGAAVSALGSSSAFAVTDGAGRFELRALPPGPYLVRAHLAGFVAPRGQVVRVLPSARASSSIALRRVNAVTPSAPPLVPASLGPLSPAPEAATPKPADEGTAPAAGGNSVVDTGEVAWRLSHARRSILKDVDQAIVASEASAGPTSFATPRVFSHALESSARLASNFFTDTPFFGQLDILTTSSFDAPQELFAARAFLARSVANMVVGAPAGDADWTVRGAVTQGDIASWVVSGDYVTRAPGRHRYDVGLSYSTQRYDGGNFAALKDVTDGSRNVGTLHAFDTLALTPQVLLTYGAGYARYDYLDASSLVSPRVGVTIIPAEHVRLNAMISRHALAPGAEEFVQRDSGIWLPPQRTFSSLDDRAPMVAERTTHIEAGIERDLTSRATASVRVFRQHVDDQLVTLFGVDQPGQPSATLGHYFVANSGAMDAAGYGAGLRAVFAARLRGSVEYSYARASWASGENLSYLMLVSPSAVRTTDERIHDVSTSVEADVPETSTRVMILYRVNNGFAAHDITSRAGVDGRFDVQVRQSLPFLDFSTAKWEMLVTVRNFFRDSTGDSSIYDELLVVRPPKRVVGGLTLRF